MSQHHEWLDFWRESRYASVADLHLAHTWQLFALPVASAGRVLSAGARQRRRGLRRTRSDVPLWPQCPRCSHRGRTRSDLRLCTVSNAKELRSRSVRDPVAGATAFATHLFGTRSAAGPSDRHPPLVRRSERIACTCDGIQCPDVG